jgi:hypothetical protein
MVTCIDSSTFYFMQLIFLVHPEDLHDLPLHSSVDSMVVVSKSADGGNTWGDPVVAVTKVLRTDRFGVVHKGHTLDKEWIATDPSNPQRMDFSYTDFDDSNPM